MFYFAQLKHDADGRVTGVELARLTQEYRERQLVKVVEPVRVYDTLGAALAEARKLNAATA